MMNKELHYPSYSFCVYRSCCYCTLAAFAGKPVCNTEGIHHRLLYYFISGDASELPQRVFAELVHSAARLQPKCQQLDSSLILHMYSRGTLFSYDTRPAGSGRVNYLQLNSGHQICGTEAVSRVIFVRIHTVHSAKHIKNCCQSSGDSF